MENRLNSTVRADGTGKDNPDFSQAPDDWSPQVARNLAEREGLTLGAEHWAVIETLQSYYARNRDDTPHLAELKQALEDRFAAEGGSKYLHTLFPGGPVAQGCRIAGLKAPAGAVDNGFGSVV